MHHSTEIDVPGGNRPPPQQGPPAGCRRGDDQVNPSTSESSAYSRPAPDWLSVPDIGKAAQAMLAVDIDITVEVSPQKLKHPTEHHAAFSGATPEHDCNITILETSAVRGLRNPSFG
jgi:hypothetical protein